MNIGTGMPMDRLHTFTLADATGKVTRIKISNSAGGIRRSPFLTAPLTNIVRAFGASSILQLKLFN